MNKSVFLILSASSILVGCQEYTCTQINELKQIHTIHAPKAEQAFNQCLSNTKAEHDDVDSQTVVECRITANKMYPIYDWAFEYKNCTE